MIDHIDVSLIASMDSSFIQPVASSLINAIPIKVKQGGLLPLLALQLPLATKVLGKGIKRAGSRCNKMDHMDKHFQFGSIL